MDFLSVKEMAMDKAKILKNIEDKVFLVTGGAAGIGAGIVRTLLTENARCVAFLDIAEREGATLEKELLSKFGPLRAKFINCDISDEKQLAAAFAQVFDKYRRLDVVVNNATVLSTDAAEFRKIVDVNFTATVSSTLKAMELMGEDKGGCGGAVVNISSLLAFKRTPLLPVYSSSKLAILQFSNAMGSEPYFSKSKVRMLTVCLGPTDTAILQKPRMSGFDKDYTQNLTSRAEVRQRVESAVNGILQVINEAENRTIWMVANDKPPVDISDNIFNGFDVMSKGIHD